MILSAARPTCSPSSLDASSFRCPYPSFFLFVFSVIFPKRHGLIFTFLVPFHFINNEGKKGGGMIRVSNREVSKGMKSLRVYLCCGKKITERSVFLFFIVLTQRTDGQVTRTQKKKKKNYSTEYSHVVPHHSTDSAINCLTAQIGRDAVGLVVYGRNSKVTEYFLSKYHQILGSGV